MARILLDCDGVTGDCTGHLLKNLDCGLTETDIVRWDFFEFIPKELHARAHELMNSSEFWRDMPVKRGAREAVDALRRMGHEIIVVTTPWASCPTWESERRDWLKRNLDIPRRNVLMGERKDLVFGDVLVDDKPANVSDWYAAWGRPAVIVNVPSNAAFEWEWRADSVLDGLELIDALAVG